MMPLEDLRLKTVTLLAISTMMRPSDAAPLSKIYDSSSGKFKSIQLTTKNIAFHSDGSMTINFHGIKNDYHRDGFEVNLPPASNPRLDPVRALKYYIQRTKYVRPHSLPVFLSLKEPYEGLSAKSIARILDRAIDLAGLKDQGYSAKHFRPTGATVAIESGINPNSVMRIGRWKGRETFENHYVHAFPMKSFTDLILKTSKK